MKGATNANYIPAVDFCVAEMTSTQTVNVGANWTTVGNIYARTGYNGNVISFNNTNSTFTVSKAGIYLVLFTNRHDSGAFGGTGIQFSDGSFTECSGECHNDVRMQHTIGVLPAGGTIVIRQYGDQGTMAGYGGLNRVTVVRLAQGGGA